MLICDLCGGKDNVESTSLSFEVRRKTDEKPLGTLYSQDICQTCHTQLYNMIHVYNNSLSLTGVLSKGLDLKQKVTRGATAKNVEDHYNR